MQKIAIFGGSGMTGQCVVRHALVKGSLFDLDNVNIFTIHAFLIRFKNSLINS